MFLRLITDTEPLYKHLPLEWPVSLLFPGPLQSLSRCVCLRGCEAGGVAGG